MTDGRIEGQVTDTPENVTSTADFDSPDVPVIFDPNVKPEVTEPEHAAEARGNISVNLNRVTIDGQDGFYYVIANQAFFLPKKESEDMAKFILGK